MKPEGNYKLYFKWFFRCRILVQNNSVSVFIDSGSTPVFQRDLLGVDNTGGVAYWVDDATDAYFSNLKIQEF